MLKKILPAQPQAAVDSDLLTASAIRLVNGKQTSLATVTQQPIGHLLPVSGEAIGKPLTITAPIGHPGLAAANNSVSQSQVALLNKYLNDSGQPDRFRVDPNSAEQLIQEINPATGVVIAEYSAVAFPALAKSLGLVGSLVDSRA